MIECIAVGLGGMIGAVLRYLIGLIPLREDCSFPVKTLAVNILGAFMIGLIVALAAKHPNLNPRLILFLKTGICGGFTTFSTFALETVDLIHAGSPMQAILYVALSLILGIAAVISAQMLLRGVAAP